MVTTPNKSKMKLINIGKKNIIIAIINLFTAVLIAFCNSSCLLDVIALAKSIIVKTKSITMAAYLIILKAKFK